MKTNDNCRPFIRVQIMANNLNTVSLGNVSTNSNAWVIVDTNRGLDVAGKTTFIDSKYEDLLRNAEYYLDLKAAADKLAEALENIVEHQSRAMFGKINLSTTATIARKALAEYRSYNEQTRGEK